MRAYYRHGGAYKSFGGYEDLTAGTGTDAVPLLGVADTTGQVALVETAMGHNVGVVRTFHQWGDTTPTSRERTLASGGRSLIPSFRLDGSTGNTYPDVNSGTTDVWIANSLQAYDALAVQYNVRVWWVPQQEINGTDQAVAGTATQAKAMLAHIANLARGLGLQNTSVMPILVCAQFSTEAPQYLPSPYPFPALGMTAANPNYDGILAPVLAWLTSHPAVRLVIAEQEGTPEVDGDATTALNNYAVWAAAHVSLMDASAYFGGHEPLSSSDGSLAAFVALSQIPAFAGSGGGGGGGGGTATRVTGLVHRKSTIPVSSSWRTHIQGIVLTADWSQLQSSAYASLSSFSSVGSSGNSTDWASVLAQAATYGWKVRIRVDAGGSAPSDVKALSGGPLAWTNPTDNVSGTIPVWWHKEYSAAYKDLMTRLVTALTSYTQVAEIAATYGGTIYSEPCIREISDLGTVVNGVVTRQPNSIILMNNTDYTSDLDKTALLNSPALHNACDPNARFSFYFAHNPWQSYDRTNLRPATYDPITGKLTVPAHYATDTSITQAIAFMEKAKAVLGTRAVIGNNSWVSRTYKYSDMYDHMIAMHAAGQPVSVQSETYPKITNSPPKGAGITLHQMLVNAAAAGIQSVELPTNQYVTDTAFTTTVADGDATALAANAL